MGLSGHASPSAVLGVTITFTIIAASAVILRLYSRVFIVHSPGKDDAFIVAALIKPSALQSLKASKVRDQRHSEETASGILTQRVQ